VSWPKASEGGKVIGKEEIRAYWIRQSGEFDPHVEPLAMTEEEGGKTRQRAPTSEEPSRKCSFGQPGFPRIHHERWSYRSYDLGDEADSNRWSVCHLRALILTGIQRGA